MNQLKSDHYKPVEIERPAILGKRKHDDESKKKTVAVKLKKRVQKEESKDVADSSKRP
jgi:hypothetical protein